MVSTGTRPRYSMRLATSEAVGAVIDPLTNSPLCVRARYWKLGTSASDRRDAENFRGRCHSRSAFGDGILDHGHHSGFDRRAMDDVGIGVFRDQITHASRHFDDFENTVAAAIAGATATVAAVRLIDGIARLEAQRGKARIVANIIGVKFFLGLAAITEHADQALGDGGAQSRFEQEPL